MTSYQQDYCAILAEKRDRPLFYSRNLVNQYSLVEYLLKVDKREKTEKRGLSPFLY